MRMAITPYNIDKDRLPKKLIIRGIIYVGIVAALALAILFIIPITDKIKGNAQITINGLPQEVQTTTDGILSYHTEDDTAINKGDLLATQIWTHDEEEIDQINDLFSAIPNFSNASESDLFIKKLLEIDWADISGDVSSLAQAYEQYRLLSYSLNAKDVKSSIADQIDHQQKALERLQVLAQKQASNAAMLKNQIAQDSALAATGAIPTREVELRRNELLTYEQQQIENSLQQERIKQEIAALTTLQNRDTRSVRIERTQHLADLQDQYNVLVAKYHQLAQERYIYAPTSGKISIASDQQDQQYRVSGTGIATIIPTAQDESLAVEVILSASRAGEIHAGQQVFLDLKEYQPAEYGYLIGTIKDAPRPNGKDYRVDIELQDGLTTSRGIQLPPLPLYTGNAEIIIRKETLAQKIKRELTHQSEKWTR